MPPGPIIPGELIQAVLHRFLVRGMRGRAGVAALAHTGTTQLAHCDRVDYPPRAHVYRRSAT